MQIRDKININLSEKSREKLERISRRLTERKVKKIDMSEFINPLIESITDKKIDQIVDENTPLEWKVSKLLNDPNGQKELKKLVGIIDRKQKLKGKMSPEEAVS